MTRWVRFEDDGRIGFGTLDGDTIAVHDGDLFAGAQPSGRTVALDRVALLTPCAPSKMICLWNNSRAAAAKLNLAEPLPPLLKMDVVFLRNVLIYFADENKREVLGRVVRQLRPDGYMFVGGAETLIGFDQDLKRVRINKTSCYQPRES